MGWECVGFAGAQGLQLSGQTLESRWRRGVRRCRGFTGAVPLESLSGSCPASQRHAEGFSKPSAHFSLQTSAQRTPFQTELPRATTVSHRLCFYLLQRSYFLIHLSLPSPFCMASRLTCLKARLHYIPSFLGSEACPAFSAHDLSLSLSVSLSLTHTHTHTHQSLQGQQLLSLSTHDLTHTYTHTLCLSKVNGCFLLPNFNFPLTYHLLSPGLPSDLCLLDLYSHPLLFTL